MNSQSSTHSSALPMVLFTYSTKEISKTQKVRFFYALNGRNGSVGILESLKAIHLGVSVVLVPSENTEEFEFFLKKWKATYSAKEMLVE